MRKSYLFFICIAFTLAPNAWGDGLKSGNKYHVFQYRANIREKPDRNSKVLAILNFGDQVEVTKVINPGEEINDVWGYWCEVKYGRITGYTFGGNLAVGTLITDIDKNGVDDYFCYRFSRAAEYGLLEPSTDIKIRINNNEVAVKELRGYMIYKCEIINRQNYVLIKFTGYHGYFMNKVYPDGEIHFIELLEGGEEYNPDEY